MLCELARLICATEQTDVIQAAEATLRALLNGAVALRHLRIYPAVAGEAVKHVLSLQRNEGERQ